MYMCNLPTKKSIMEILLKHLLYGSIILVVLLLYQVTGIHCPIKYFFGIPCPACGMTRSFLSLLRLDIRGSFSYNPMSCLVIIAVLLGFHKKLFNHKKIIDGILIIAAIVTLAFYIYRVFSLNVDV